MPYRPPRRKDPAFLICLAVVVAIFAAGSLAISSTFFRVHTAMDVVEWHIAQDANRDALLSKTARYAYGAHSLFRESGMTEASMRKRLASSFTLKAKRFPNVTTIEPGPDLFGPRETGAAIATARIALDDAESPIGSRVADIKLPFVLLIHAGDKYVIGIETIERKGSIEITDPYLAPKYTDAGRVSHSTSSER